MNLRFTPRATRDLIDIANYIRERAPAASLRVRSAILDSLRNLVLFPEIGRRQTVEGVRKLVTRKYPYLVYYTLDLAAEETIILTIQHPAREREYEDA
jgi:toxin ParE1/3/4